jgi:hypothetical protein
MGIDSSDMLINKQNVNNKSIIGYYYTKMLNTWKEHVPIGKNMANRCRIRLS